MRGLIAAALPPTRDTVLTLLDDVFAEFVIREAQ